jgi:hypothetical protein
VPAWPACPSPPRRARYADRAGPSPCETPRSPRARTRRSNGPRITWPGRCASGGEPKLLNHRDTENTEQILFKEGGSRARFGTNLCLVTLWPLCLCGSNLSHSSRSAAIRVIRGFTFLIRFAGCHSRPSSTGKPPEARVLEFSI